jgi:alpha-beta hydrolase superfamily lysophospholipase
MFTACSKLIFQPTSIQYTNPEQRGIVTEDLFIPSSDDVVLHGWRLPAVGKVRGSVVFLHGNAENISSHIGGVYWLPERGFEVFLFDYRGYGRSGGAADLDGVLHDAEHMIDYARRNALSEAHSVTVLGHSMGGSIAISALAMLADKTGINGLITISAFSDYHQVARDALAGYWLTRPLRWPLSFTISNRYRPADTIRQLSPVPVYIMQADADEIIPAYHAQQLFDAAATPKYLGQLAGGHNEVLSKPDNQQRLTEILQALNSPAE